MKRVYQVKRFNRRSLQLIDIANTIIDEYTAKGFTITLRQLYYQFVSRGFIPNTQREYNNLGSLISNGRLAGLIDWEAITDRTRNVRMNSHWSSEAEILESAADQFAIDKRETQDKYIEVWIEKDALVGVIADVCSENDVPYFSCRGYTSQSEMWAAARRIQRGMIIGREPKDEPKDAIIIHLGDHDPSGIDMSRDIEERLKMFIEVDSSIDAYFTLERIALTRDQVNHYNLPPNPAKSTDTRFMNYVIEHGRESWELDALDPEVIVSLINNAISNHTDEDKYIKAARKEKKMRENIKKLIRDLG